MMKQTAAMTIFAVLTFLWAALPTQAEISRMTVHVDGLTCPFCVFNLEKKLKPLRDVQDVNINLKTGNATMVLGKGRGPTVTQIQRAVRDAGFTPRTLGLTAIGTLSVKDRYILLSVRSVGGDIKPAYGAFYLYQKGQGDNFFDEKTRARLERLAKQNAVVVVTGNVYEHAEGLPALSADGIKVVPKEENTGRGSGADGQ